MTLLLDEVVKHYRGASETVRAVDGVTLHVQRGEMVALYGPSGSGKTTLLLLAAGLVRPDAGTVTVEERDVGSLSRRESARYRREVIGVVLQHSHMMAGVSAVENAALKLLADQGSLMQARRRARPWLGRVGLDRQRDQLPDQLSGGERQRVAVARALANDPVLLLADEPTGSLDSERGRKVLELLREICHERGMAVLLATHDSQAAEIADRAVVLRDGKLHERHELSEPAQAQPRQEAVVPGSEGT
ncbi:MAG TPA: ABC transporter ATP-binding protein [Conexibacter sp.]|jgi:putative ABC transport system ATP-binding protein|nr:ABC transporter ATP-binding protein [Conexibacter sp.]